MIRREITSPNGEKLWLLISQVEHAHVSGELARDWREEFTPDIIEAITHHDDGWAAWEAEPKLNPKIGAPFSFLEMPVAAALVIWDHSIAAAEKFGPLAAYIVAGHFYNLLSNSENAKDPLAVAWLTVKRKQRTVWLDEWIRADPSHTLEYAKRAQHMLLVADLFSLWLCCDCPTGAEQKSILGQSTMKLQTDTLFNQFQFTVPEHAINKSLSQNRPRRGGQAHFAPKTPQNEPVPDGSGIGSKSPDGERIEGLNWTVGVRPYPFKIAPLSLAASAMAAAAVRYASWPELKAASWPVQLEWRLVEGKSPPGSAA